MKETLCMMLAIFAGLGVVMLTGALIEGGLSVSAFLGLALCVAAARVFYRLASRPSRRIRRRIRHHAGPTLGLSKETGSLRAA